MENEKVLEHHSLLIGYMKMFWNDWEWLQSSQAKQVRH